jgi:hypothetical protein
MNGNLRFPSPLRRLGVLLVCIVAAAAATATASGVGDSQPCDVLEVFDPDNFPETPEIDNTFFPLAPGSQRVFEGDVDGVPHRVSFTVTDLTKKIAGVETVVVWDVDESEGVVEEAELAFFAQDNDGNVWNLGEYPEEFDGRRFAGAPSTWISGEDDAQAGIHMAAAPQVGSSFYLQGFAPAIDFLDCARVAATGQSAIVPAGTFSDVLVTEETNPALPEDGVQTKHHAPGVGIVEIGFTVPGSAPESLELVELNQLDDHDMKHARREALQLDRRGYRNSEVYRETEPADELDG